MNAIQHLGSTAVGFVTANEVVQTSTQLPTTKGEVIALVSAVVVQSLIYGVSKLFKWLSSKNKKPEISEPATPAV